jgi:hypothetical protein
MITRKALGAIALATTCLAPFAAFAQAPAAPAAPATPETSGLAIGGVPVTGEIGIGVMGVMGSNADQAGRYSGINTTGIDILGNFDVTGRSPWDSGGTRYYELIGNNLVFQTGNNLGTDKGAGTPSGSQYNSLIGSNQLVNAGSLGFNVGDQGTWEAGVDYHSITYTGRVIDSVYNPNGSYPSLNSPLLPFGGSTGAGPGPVTGYNLNTFPKSAFQPIQTGTRRDIIGANFKYIYGNWEFSGAFQHIHKEGTLEESYYGTYGGTAFALPIDYDIDRYDATAAYTTRTVQAQFQYTFSHFSEGNLYVNLPYFVSGTSAANVLQREAAYSLPPSNHAQYFTVNLGSNDLIPRTRLNFNARLGFEGQDANFPPNTADPIGLSSAGHAPFQNLSDLNGTLVGTNASSLNAMATVYQINVRASSNPFENADARAYYGVDGRSVSLNQYAVYGSGTGSDSAPGSNAPVAFVVPQDWLKQNAGIEMGYNILPQYNTKLTGGYRLDVVDRSNAQVGHSWQDTGTIGLSSELGPELDGKLTYQYSSRSGNINYLGPWQFLTGSATYSGAFYQAPMTSNAVTARADYTPMNTLSADWFLEFKNENYNYPAATTANGVTAANPPPLNGVGTGLKQYQSLSFGPDVTWRPTKTVNVHVFYTYEMLFYNTEGNGACSNSNTGACAGSVGFFSNKVTTDTQTVGVSGDWQVNEKLKLKADTTFSYGSAAFIQFDGVFVPTPTQSYQNVQNYPDIDTRMYSLSLTATYQISPSMEWAAQVAYLGFHNNDWKDSPGTLVGTTTGSTAIGYLTPGYASPNYSIVTLMTGVKFKF